LNFEIEQVKVIFVQTNKMSKKFKKAEVAPTGKKRDVFLLFTLGLTFLIFLKGLNYDILNFDDNEYFSNYSEILKLSFANVIKYFSKYYVLMYQPLPVLSFAITHALFDFSPAAQHALNLGFHLFNIYLVYTFVGLLNNKPGIKQTVAFLFALHPLAVEAVMWISCRSSVMYVCFYLLGLIAFLRYRENSDKKQLLLCYLWFLLSLLSKAQAVTFPLVLLCIEVFHFKTRLNWQLLMQKIPFFILSLIFGLVAIGDTDTGENMAFIANAFSGLDKIFLVFYELTWYLIKLIIPLNLSPIYVYPVKTDGLLPWIYYASALVFVVVAWLVFKNYKNRSYLLFGIVFFYLVLSVALQIIPSRLFIVADRYGYLPNIGIFYILACLFAEWKEGGIRIFSNFKDKTWLGYGIGAVLVLLSFLQVSVWENNLSLSDRIIDVNPETAYIGRAFGIRGNYKLNTLRKPDEALADYQKAAALDSTDLLSRYQMAMMYQSAGDSNTAIYYYRQAHKADPSSPMPLTDLGVLYSNQKKHLQAMALADSALKIEKNFPNAMVLKAVCMLNLGDPAGAEKQLSDCIQFNPDFPEAYKNRGIIRINDLKNKDGACQDFRKAADLGDKEAVDIVRSYCE